MGRVTVEKILHSIAHLEYKEGDIEDLKDRFERKPEEKKYIGYELFGYLRTIFSTNTVEDNDYRTLKASFKDFTQDDYVEYVAKCSEALRFIKEEIDIFDDVFISGLSGLSLTEVNINKERLKHADLVQRCIGEIYQPETKIETERGLHEGLGRPDIILLSSFMHIAEDEWKETILEPEMSCYQYIMLRILDDSFFNRGTNKQKKQIVSLDLGL